MFEIAQGRTGLFYINYTIKITISDGDSYDFYSANVLTRTILNSNRSC
jgi:hypothetical protein